MDMHASSYQCMCIYLRLCQLRRGLLPLPVASKLLNRRKDWRLAALTMRPHMGPAWGQAAMLERLLHQLQPHGVDMNLTSCNAVTWSKQERASGQVGS